MAQHRHNHADHRKQKARGTHHRPAPGRAAAPKGFSAHPGPAGAAAGVTGTGTLSGDVLGTVAPGSVGGIAADGNPVGGATGVGAGGVGGTCGPASMPDPPDAVKGTTVEEADPAGVIPDDWAGAQVAGAAAGGVLLGASSEDEVLGPDIGPRRADEGV